MSHPVILFDGICNLCTSSVQFVIKHDTRHIFRFASLQGKKGQQLLQANAMHVTDLNSFILYENGKIYTRSSAALRVSKKLNGLWPLLYLFIIVPPFIRNSVYNFISKNRYRWFGKKEICWLPDTHISNLFFD